jgi:phosphate transport system permease protein
VNIKKMKPTELIMHVLTWGAAILTICALIYLIGFILLKGLPYLKPSLFSLTYNSDNVSLMPALISTVFMTFLSLLIAAPLGIGAAIYLAEYVRREGRFVTFVRMMSETLAGIPSIVYGLFGMLFFVNALRWGYSLIAGAFTLSIMILPLLMRSTEEALKSVPDVWREGSFGLGAGKLRTVFKVVLPAASPGILAGIILAVGRVVGETAALIFTSGTVAQVPSSALKSARTLSVHMYVLSGEGLHMGEGYATAVVLLVVVVAINALSASLAKKIGAGDK